MANNDEKVSELQVKERPQANDLILIVDKYSTPNETKTVTVSQLDLRYMPLIIALS